MNSMAFQIRLDTNIIQLPNASGFIGKEVIIMVVEIVQEAKPQKTTWRYLGAANMKGTLDNQNIRDLAYE